MQKLILNTNRLVFFFLGLIFNYLIVGHYLENAGFKITAIHYIWMGHKYVDSGIGITVTLILFGIFCGWYLVEWRYSSRIKSLKDDLSSVKTEKDSLSKDYDELKKRARKAGIPA